MDYIYETTEKLAISNEELLLAMVETGFIDPVADEDGALYIEEEGVLLII